MLLGSSTLALADDTMGVTDTTIRIGIINVMSGTGANMSAAGYGIQSIYRYYNEQGGINGRKFDIVMLDDACNEAQGVADAHRLISEDKVFLLNGNICSGPALAMRPIIAQAGIPWVVSTAANQNIGSPVTPNIFQAIDTSLDGGAAQARFALSKPGVHRIAVVEHTNEWAKGGRDSAVAYLKSQNITPTELTMERGQTDATAQVLRLKAENPDAILLFLYEPETAIFLRTAHQFGLNTLIVGTGAGDFSNIERRLGDTAAMRNYYQVYRYRDLTDGPKLAKWRGIITQYLPPGQSFTDYSLYGAGSALAVVHVLQSLGRDVTWQRFIEGMNQLHDFDTGIYAEPISFSPTEHIGIHGVGMIGFDKDGKATIFQGWDQPVD